MTRANDSIDLLTVTHRNTGTALRHAPERDDRQMLLLVEKLDVKLELSARVLLGPRERPSAARSPRPPLYELWRVLSSRDPAKKALFQKMVGNSARIEIPPGIKKQVPDYVQPQK